MIKKVAIGGLFIAFLLPSVSLGQQDEPQVAFVFATYFVCTPDRESRADEIINSSFKPHYDLAVEQEEIISWSWQSHFVGGNWRRVLVIIAADMDSVIDASGAIGEAISESTPEAGRAFSGICSSHEDYIWEMDVDVGNVAEVDDRGAAGFSVYMQCDLSKEKRADELVSDVIGPIYDKYVSEGALTSWNWLRHNVGGKWRRLLIMSAGDHKSLARARAAIVEEFDGRKLERAAEEMNEICHTHQDYMWDILVQSP